LAFCLTVCEFEYSFLSLAVNLGFFVGFFVQRVFAHRYSGKEVSSFWGGAIKETGAE